MPRDSPRAFTAKLRRVLNHSEPQVSGVPGIEPPGTGPGRRACQAQPAGPRRSCSASRESTVSGYLLALGTGLAGTAYLARRYGTRPVYRASLAAFTAASALCTLAPGIAALIAFRAVQGLVAAPLVPLAMSMLLGKSGRATATVPLAWQDMP